MRVGFITPGDSWESLNHVRRMTVAALTPRHEVRMLPPEYSTVSRQRRRELLKSWLDGLEVLVGQFDDDILCMRREMTRCLPQLGFVLGAMPRGAPGLSRLYKYVDTSDLLVCNCSADLALSKEFFPNATVRLIPLAYDETMFYRADATARQAVRTECAVEPTDKIVLYSGRLTVEKNIHTVLRAFRVVLDAVPRARLLIAGNEVRAPFEEFGVLPLSIKRLLRRLRKQLGCDPSQVMFVGARSPAQLRDLYSAGDVLLNLTLHHDENFGLAQVEAMACGLPVVGTAWGGLKDTILDGATGAHVPALVTATGVKVDWWSAANSVVQLLADGGPSAAMRERCQEHVRRRYSQAAYADGLEQALVACRDTPTRTAETLKPSAFAREVWSVCAKSPDEPPPYRRGRAAMQLYRRLITPYATAVPVETCLPAMSIWCLPVPLVVERDDTITVHDPIYPFEVLPPPPLADAVRTLVRLFGAKPVQVLESLTGDQPLFRDAIVWMHDNGLVLRTREGEILPDWEKLPVGLPALRMQRVDHDLDVIWFS